MTWYARGAIGARPVFSRNLQGATAGEGEVTVALDELPDADVVIAADGQSVVPIALSLADAKAAASRTIKALRDAKLGGGCMTGAGQIDTDDTSRSNISGAVSMAMLAQAAGQPFSISWRMHDNSSATLDASGMMGVGVAVGQYVSAVYAVSFATLDAIEAATTLAEVAAIDLDAIVWPA